MNLEERIKNLKKKNKAKQVQGLDALIELVDLLRNERGDLKEILKKDNSKEIITAISKLEDTFNGIKPPDYNKLVEAVKNVKIIPQVNVTVDYLKNVEKLLKELKQEQQADNHIDIEKLLKELRKPKNAIAVRLTKKDEEEFYNAILSVISGGGGGGAAIITSPTDFEGAPVIVGIAAVEITFVGTTKAISIQSSPDNIGKIWIGKSNVTNAGANAVKELLPGQSYDFDYNDASNPTYVVSDTVAQRVFKFALL